MFKLVQLQLALALIGIFLGVLISGRRGLVSAAFGGIVCVVIPTLMFACYLHIKTVLAGGHAQVMTFFVGEAMKVVLMVCLLHLAPLLYVDLDWKTLIIGLGVTLQAYLLALRLNFDDVSRK